MTKPDTAALVEGYDTVALYNAVRLAISKVPNVETITLDNTAKYLRVSAVHGAIKFTIKCAPMGKTTFQIGCPVDMLQTMLRQRKFADFYIEGKELIIKEARFTGHLTTVPAIPWQPTKTENPYSIPEEVLVAIEDHALLNKVLETEVLLAAQQGAKGAEIAVFDRLHFCYMQSSEVKCPTMYLPIDVFRAMANITPEYMLSVSNSRAVGFAKGWFYSLPFVQTLTAKIDQVKCLAERESKFLGSVDANDLKAAVSDAWSSTSFIVEMAGKDDTVTLSTKWKAGKVVAEVKSAKVDTFSIGVDLRPLNDILSAMSKDTEVINLYLADNILLLIVETPEWDITYGTITRQLQA